ncbi:MAG: GxxExxY protein, partial [Bdellovibrionales bacterium]|nr:GxxExxY protein [Bdellovibrionales bacterium]
AAYRVHCTLGPGLMEHVYQNCLEYEIRKRGLDVRSEIYLPVVYDSMVFKTGYRIDLLVESEVIIELKVVAHLLPLHKAQLLTYLKLAKKPVGLLINFNSKLIKEGIIRLVN